MIAFRTYQMAEAAHFLRSRDPHGGFGNPASGYPIHVNDVKIDSSETYYQAMRFPHLPDFQAEIISQGKGIPAKRKAYERIAESRPDWDGVKVAVMRHALRLKLMWNHEKVLDLFDNTGEMPIIETSMIDDFWGAKPDGAGQLVGRNVLGRLLMELRVELQLDPDAYREAVPPPSFPHAQLLGRVIEETRRDTLPMNEPQGDLFGMP